MKCKASMPMHDAHEDKINAYTEERPKPSMAIHQNHGRETRAYFSRSSYTGLNNTVSRSISPGHVCLVSSSILPARVQD